MQPLYSGPNTGNPGQALEGWVFAITSQSDECSYVLYGYKQGGFGWWWTGETFDGVLAAHV